MEASVWYYVVNGEQQGPVTFGDLKAAAADGRLTREALVWEEGTPDWVAAKTVAGLFPVAPPPVPVRPATDDAYALADPPTTTAPLPLPPPRPAPRPAAEPLSLDDAPPAAPRELPEWVKLAQVFVRRALTPDPAAAAPTADEGEKLTAAGVMDATARKLAVWRRSVLFVAAVPCAFAALFGLVDVVAMGKDEREQFSGFGLLLQFVQALGLFALPVAAVFGALAYDRLSVSAKWVLIGGLVSFAVPLAVAFTPAAWQFDLPSDGRETVADAEMKRTFLGMVAGITFSCRSRPQCCRCCRRSPARACE